MSDETRTGRLEALIDRAETLIVPGAYDALSARLVEGAGFEAVYVGSWATAASAYGVPDTGQLAWPELVEHAGRCASAVSVPVIADAEGAEHDVAGIGEAIRAFEAAGVAAVHVEDQVSGKHTADERVLRGTGEMCALVEAAVAARSSEDFLIVARTDAAWAGHDNEAIVERLNAFAEAGADLVFPAGMAPVRIAAVRDRIRARVMLTNWPGTTPANAREAGIAVVLYYGYALCAAFTAVRGALAHLREPYGARTVETVLAAARDIEPVLAPRSAPALRGAQ